MATYWATVKIDGKEKNGFKFSTSSKDNDYIFLAALKAFTQSLEVVLPALGLGIDDCIKRLNTASLVVESCGNVIIEDKVKIIYATEYCRTDNGYTKRYYGMHRYFKTPCFLALKLKEQ